MEAGTHQGGGSCYSRSRAARPPALEAAPRLCLHHHQPAEEASRHLQPNRSMPPWSSGEPEAPGFRIGCYPRGGGAHRPQAEGRRTRASRGDGGGQEGVECWTPAEYPDAAGQDGRTEQGGMVGYHREGGGGGRSRRAWPPSGDREWKELRPNGLIHGVDNCGRIQTPGISGRENRCVSENLSSKRKRHFCSQNKENDFF